MVSHEFSATPKAVPTSQHTWGHDLGRGRDIERLPYHGRLFELFVLTIKQTLLQSVFLPHPVCITIKVSCFSTSALPVVPTVKSTFQPINSKNREWKTWQLPLGIVWEFKELSVFPMLIFQVFFLLEWKQLSLAPWAEADQDYEVHRCSSVLASKWKWVHQLGLLRRPLQDYCLNNANCCRG